MTHSELKQRLRAVLNAMDGVAISGIKNRQIVTGCETILSEIVQADIEADPTQEDK